MWVVSCRRGWPGGGFAFPSRRVLRDLPQLTPSLRQDPDATVSLAQLVLLTHISNIGCSLSAAATFCILLVCCFSR